MAKKQSTNPPANPPSPTVSTDFAKLVARDHSFALDAIDFAASTLHLQQHLDAAAAEAYKAPDIPLDPKDLEIISLGARASIVKVLYTSTPDPTILEKAVASTIRSLLYARSPLDIPVSWQRLALMAKKETERLRTDLGHAPSEAELKDAVLAAAMGEMISYNTKHPRRDPDHNPSFTEDTYRAGLARLRKTGLLHGLDHLSEITSLRVTYRPRTLEARRYLGDILKNWHQRPADCVTGFTAVGHLAAFRATETTPHPLGLHSQRIFGPLVDNTCACGKYKNWDTQIECDRCHVTTGPSSLRDHTNAYIEVPPALHADFVLATIPVIPPTLRPCYQTRNTWEFSDADRAYTRMLLICYIITSAGAAAPVLAPEAAQLLSGCMSDLTGPEGTNSF